MDLTNFTNKFHGVHPVLCHLQEDTIHPLAHQVTRSQSSGAGLTATCHPLKAQRQQFQAIFTVVSTGICRSVSSLYNLPHCTVKKHGHLDDCPCVYLELNLLYHSSPNLKADVNVLL